MNKVKERLYDFPAGAFCGVLMPEKVMKKIAKLHHKHNEEIRRVLYENKEHLYSSHWTMAVEEGKETVYVTYTLSKPSCLDGIEQRINLYAPPKCRYQEDVYIVKNHDEAEGIARDLINE